MSYKHERCGMKCVLTVFLFLLLMAGIGGVIELAKGASGGAAHILWVAIFVLIVVGARSRL